MSCWWIVLLAGRSVLVGSLGVAAALQAQQSTAGARSNECPVHLEHGADLGIEPVAADLADSYGLLFCKYTEVVASNGKPIRIFAQREISNDQIVHARSVLEFFLEPVPGTRFGSDKTAIANRMADNQATLLMFRGSDGEFEIERVRGVRGQPLYENETVPTGSPWYLENDYEDHRDASFEEILHLVHDTGIGIDFDGAPTGSAPEFQKQIRAAQIDALDDAGLWAQGERTADWIAELRDEGSLTQEYLASVVDSYYGLWGAFTEREGGMWGIYAAKTREDIAERDPLGYELMTLFLNPYLSYEARIPEAFTGSFVTVFDSRLPYTHKSQYLLNVTLTGARDSGIVGNDRDNRMRGNGGANLLDGGDGMDTVTMSGARSEYVAQLVEDGVLLTDTASERDGADTLRRVEWVEFTDGVVAIAELRK